MRGARDRLPNIALIDAHAETDRRADDTRQTIHPFALNLRALVVGETSVVRFHCAEFLRLCQLVR